MATIHFVYKPTSLQIALAECRIDLHDRAAAQALLAQASRAHAAHAELAPHLVAPLQVAQARLRGAVR